MEFLNKDSNLCNLYAFCLESIYQWLAFIEDMILVTELDQEFFEDLKPRANFSSPWHSLGSMLKSLVLNVGLISNNTET